MDVKTQNTEGDGLSDPQLQGLLRKMLREGGHASRLEIQYIRRGWGQPLVAAVVFDADSDESSILVVNQRRDGWLWAVDGWS